MPHSCYNSYTGKRVLLDGNQGSDDEGELSQNDEYSSCTDNEEVGASDKDNEDIKVYPTLLLGQTSRFGQAIRINRRFLR